MASLLFLFILVLMAYILQFKEKASADELVSKTQNAILEEMKTSLEKKGIKVEIDKSKGVLRIPEDQIGFYSSTTDLQTSIENIYIVKNELENFLPCFAHPKDQIHCKSKTFQNKDIQSKVIFESVFIEGHSDPQPLTGLSKQKYGNNYALSSARAQKIFSILTNNMDEKSLLYRLRNNIQNSNGLYEGLISVAGYGATRSIANIERLNSNDPEIRKNELKRDRRIDIRLVMSATAELKK